MESLRQQALFIYLFLFVVGGCQFFLLSLELNDLS